MKFIHCSDIHLDSRMESNLTEAQARERNAEICASFGRLVDEAARQKVAAVLIAGDLFDTERATAQTADYILSRIAGVPEVDFLYLRGNHDETVFDGMKLPENLKTFSREWTCYRYGDVVITGLEMDAENCLEMYRSLKLSPENINIVMLHGQESTRPGNEQICLPMLRGKHIHYLALGHIHSFKCEPLDLQGLYCYSGCLEGRGFDECGDKGFVFLNVESGRVRPQFVPFARRTLRTATVDITGLVKVGQILEAAEQALRNIPRESLVKLTLTGSYTLDTQKDLRFFQKMLEQKFYFLKIKDESRLSIEKGSYEYDISLKGAFIRLVMASDKSDEQKEQIISYGIRALSGGEVEL